MLAGTNEEFSFRCVTGGDALPVEVINCFGVYNNNKIPSLSVEDLQHFWYCIFHAIALIAFVAVPAQYLFIFLIIEKSTEKVRNRSFFRSSVLFMSCEAKIYNLGSHFV